MEQLGKYYGEIKISKNLVSKEESISSIMIEKVTDCLKNDIFYLVKDDGKYHYCHACRFLKIIPKDNQIKYENIENMLTDILLIAIKNDCTLNGSIYYKIIDIPYFVATESCYNKIICGDVIDEIRRLKGENKKTQSELSNYQIKESEKYADNKRKMDALHPYYN